MYRVSQQVLDKNFEEKSVNVTKNEKVKILSWNQNKNKKLERWLVSLEFTRENNHNNRFWRFANFFDKILIEMFTKTCWDNLYIVRIRNSSNNLRDTVSTAS